MDEKYVNSLQLSVSFYDVTTTFYRQTKTDNETMRNEMVDIIRMSPQMAKAYAKMLTDNIDAYEKEYGKIPFPQAQDKQESID